MVKVQCWKCKQIVTPIPVPGPGTPLQRTSVGSRDIGSRVQVVGYRGVYWRQRQHLKGRGSRARYRVWPSKPGRRRPVPLVPPQVKPVKIGICPKCGARLVYD